MSIPQVSNAISFARKPALLESKKITLFLCGCLVVPRYERTASCCCFVKTFACFDSDIMASHSLYNHSILDNNNYQSSGCQGNTP